LINGLPLLALWRGQTGRTGRPNSCSKEWFSDPPGEIPQDPTSAKKHISNDSSSPELLACYTTTLFQGSHSFV